MRVVVNALAARTGGGLTYLRSLLPAALEADPNLELTILVSGEALLPEFANAELVVIPTAASLPRRLAWEQLRLGSFAARRRADVVFAPSEIAPLWSPVPVLLGFQNPYLFLPRLPLESPRQRARFRVLRSAARASARRADMLLFVSDAFRRVAEGQLPRTRAARATVTVGLDSRFVAEGDAGPFSDLRPYVLCVADVYPYKALPVAVRAFAQVATPHPGLRLVLAGRSVDLRESAKLDRTIREAGLESRVTRLESVDYDDMPSLYRGASCFVFPSLVESLGLPPLEALACGTPVVAARATVTPEVLGGAAAFFAPNDAADCARQIETVLGSDVPAAAAEVLARHDRAAAGRALLEAFRVAAAARA